MKSAIAALCLVLCASCATYHLSTQSLLDQFAHSTPQTKFTVLVVPPFFFFPGIVKGNDLTSIKVLDKNGNEKVLQVTNRMGIRFTKVDSTRTTFYFNTLLLKDSTITGSKTHFFNDQIRPIRFVDIAKIEIQR